MTFVIEKGIPIPTVDGRSKTGITAVLRAMDVGDSVFVQPAQATGARSVMAAINKRTEKRFVARSVEDKAIRIWRTE